MTNIALVHGSYYTRNFGDLLLAELVAKRIRAHGLRPICPWLMHEASGQVSFEMGKGLCSILPMRPLVFGGGGYISSQGGRRRALRWLLPALQSRSLGMPFIIVAPGSDDVLSKSVRGYYRLLFNMAEEVSVRDEETRNALRAAGVERDLPVTIDTAVSISVDDIPEKNALEAEKLLPTRGAICLNAPLMGREAIFEFVRLVRDATQSSSTQRVWLFENEPFNIKSLLAALEYHGMENDITLYHKDMWTVAAIIQRCRAVVTTQLHVGIVAYALGVPPCSLSSHEKTKRFYRQIGRTIWQKDISSNGSNPEHSRVELECWLNSITENQKEYFDLDAILLRKNKEKAERNLIMIDRYIERHA